MCVCVSGDMLTCKRPLAGTLQTRSPPSACSLQSIDTNSTTASEPMWLCRNVTVTTCCSAQSVPPTLAHQQAELQFSSGLHLEALAAVTRWQHLRTHRGRVRAATPCRQDRSSQVCIMTPDRTFWNDQAEGICFAVSLVKHCGRAPRSCFVGSAPAARRWWLPRL